ncbi:hypothetical protein C5167_000804 [Papaver somniferum]|uniref:DOG1 domain-containing protein n=1 Tax=Papaver somniferum TaxID=3469 RepID=A0A4Y7KW85_PAPSO|nr:transcription factor TGA2.2-like [Papaver somniferum]RZC76652.1 hypothetical protein C5167_000804 [Papaver somniferum]
MANHRIGESVPSSNHQHQQQQQHMAYAVQHGLNTSSSSSTNFITQQGSHHHHHHQQQHQHHHAFDFGELEEAIVLQGVNIRNDDHHEAAKKSFYTARPAATLEMFPSWPMSFQPAATQGRSSKSGGESTDDSGSGQNTFSYNNNQHKAEFQLEPESPMSSKKSSNQFLDHQKQLVEMESDLHQNHHNTSGSTRLAAAAGGGTGLVQNQQQPKALEKRKGPGSSSSKPLDAKVLRRLAQNREAARKSRLRKKAYVQQLETSRIKLAQLEQDLHRARSQGLFLAGGGQGGNLTSDATMFDMEYARWLEEDQQHMSELRTALQSHLSDNDLRILLDGYLSHYDQIFHLKSLATKSDVFHLITGMWTTPAERCFLWMGGFRPSELLKILMPQLDPLTEQQLIGICSLQESSQQAEEALSQGLEQLQYSLSETISSGTGNSSNASGVSNNPVSLANFSHQQHEPGNVADFMGHMAMALGKLSNLEGFLRQADNLRQQTLHQMRRILTARQAARCFLAIGEYYNRLRALSSLWASRPREQNINLFSDEGSCQTTTDLHMVQQQQHSLFSNF